MKEKDKDEMVVMEQEIKEDKVFYTNKTQGKGRGWEGRKNSRGCRGRGQDEFTKEKEQIKSAKLVWKSKRSVERMSTTEPFKCWVLQLS